MKRTLPAAALAAVAALLLAACGGSADTSGSGSGSKSGSDSTVLLAASKTTNAGSARMAMTISMSMPGVPGLDGPVRLGVDGEFDFANQRGRMKFDFSGLLDALGAQAEQAAAFMPDEMRMDGTVMYMRMPALATLRPGKSWLRFDAAELAGQQGLDQSLFGSQLGQNDPSQLLEYLQGASSDVQEIGPGEVRGVATTQYHATIDLTKAPDSLTAEQKAQYEQTVSKLTAQTGLSALPVDVWVDADGLLRRMVLNMSIPASEAGSVTMLMTMDLFDFGVDVQVKPPPKRKVVDFANFAALGLG